jgi:hypothetical protein
LSRSTRLLKRRMAPNPSSLPPGTPNAPTLPPLTYLPRSDLTVTRLQVRAQTAPMVGEDAGEASEEFSAPEEMLEGADEVSDDEFWLL